MSDERELAWECYDDDAAFLARIERLFEQFEAQSRRVDACFAFDAARQRVIVALCSIRRRGGWLWEPSRLAMWGMARVLDGRFLAQHYARRQGKKLVWWSAAARAITPFGWRWEILCDRDALLLMPAWVYYPRRWWRNARLRFWWRRYEARR